MIVVSQEVERSMELGAKRRTLVAVLVMMHLTHQIMLELDFKDNLIRDDLHSSIAWWEVIELKQHVLRDCCYVLDTCCEYARSMRRVCYSFPQKQSQRHA